MLVTPRILGYTDLLYPTKDAVKSVETTGALVVITAYLGFSGAKSPINHWNFVKRYLDP
jgi:hypothetical protein